MSYYEYDSGDVNGAAKARITECVTKKEMCAITCDQKPQAEYDNNVSWDQSTFTATTCDAFPNFSSFMDTDAIKDYRNN